MAPTSMMWPDMIRNIDANHGVYEVHMEQLRSLEGSRRLGPEVLAKLEERLKLMGIGHLPTDLPTRADEPVILYRHGTMASEIIQAVQRGLSSATVGTTARALRLVNTPPPTEQMLSAQVVADQIAPAVNALKVLLDSTSL